VKSEETYSSEMVSDIDSPYAWRRLACSLILATVGGVGIWAIIVLLPEIEVEFGLSRGEASLTFVATMLGFALGNVIVGRWVDRYGITLMMIGAGIVLGLGYTVSAISSSVFVLSAAQFVVGAASATGFAPLIADLSHWFEKRRGLAVALAASGNYMAGAIWPLVLAPLLPIIGWRGAALVIAGTCLCVMLPLSLTLRRRVTEQTLAHADTVAAQRVAKSGLSPRVLMSLLFMSGIGCCVAMSMPQVHIISYCIDLGYGAAAGAGMLSLMLTGGVVSRIAFGALSDKIGGVWTLLVGASAQLVALCLFLPWNGLVPLYVISLLFGLSQGGIVPSYAMIVREYLPARQAGKLVGLAIMSTILGMALGGWMSGWIHDETGDYRLAFLNGIGWNLIPVAVMAFLLLQPKRGKPRLLGRA
jgi:MFS family permease